MKLGLYRLEIIASIVWFLMDMLWMWGFPIIGMIGFPIVVICLLRIMDTTQNKNYQYMTLICNSWLVMNGMWMLSEMIHNPNDVWYFKCVATIFGAAGVIGLIVVFFKKQTK